MTKLEIVTEWYPDEQLLSADGFEDCIIGVAYDMSKSVYKLIYSRSKCLEVLITRDKMSKEDAEEFFEFNVESAYMGDKTPIYMDDMMFYGEEPDV
jgi:hypothetical protein